MTLGQCLCLAEESRQISNIPEQDQWRSNENCEGKERVEWRSVGEVWARLTALDSAERESLLLMWQIGIFFGAYSQCLLNIGDGRSGCYCDNIGERPGVLLPYTDMFFCSKCVSSERCLLPFQEVSVAMPQGMKEANKQYLEHSLSSQGKLKRRVVSS